MKKEKLATVTYDPKKNEYVITGGIVKKTIKIYPKKEGATIRLTGPLTWKSDIFWLEVK